MGAIVIGLLVIGGVIFAVRNQETVGVGCLLAIIICVVGGLGTWGWKAAGRWRQALTLSEAVHLTEVTAQSSTAAGSEDAAPSSRVIDISATVDNDNDKIAVEELRLKLDIRHCGLGENGQPRACGPLVQSRTVEIRRQHRVGFDYSDSRPLVLAGGRSLIRGELLVTGVPTGQAAVAAVRLTRACGEISDKLCDD